MEGPELLVKISRGQQEHIDLAEVMCPICLSVLIEPVKMPCDHILCMPCFEQNVDVSSLTCPICRKRISVWCRKARKEGTLVFEALWKILQDKFSARVEARKAGLDDVDADDIIPCLPMHQFVDKGAIKSEFDLQMSRERKEMMKVKTEEDRKSVELIRKMEEEERQGREGEIEKKRKQEIEDMEMARRIEEGEGDSPIKADRGKENKASSNRGPMDSFLGISEPSKKKSSISNFSTMSPFTRPQKYEPKQFKPNTERCLSTESIQSNNSIDGELNHFKPIRSAPVSPPKRLPDGSEMEPEVIKTTPRNLSHLFSSSPGPSSTKQSNLGGPSSTRQSSSSSSHGPSSTIQSSSSTRKSSLGGRQGRNSASTRNKLDIPDMTGFTTPSCNGEPGSLYCDETLRLTLTPTPSPGLKRQSFPSTSPGLKRPVFSSTSDSVDLTLSPSPEVKRQSSSSSSSDNPASPVFKSSLDMDTQDLEQMMDQSEDYGNFDALDPSIIEEQKRMEAQIKQQIADEKFAQELQEEMDQQERLVNRQKGSADEYNLRDSAKKLGINSRLPLSPRTPRNGKSKLAMSPKTPGMSGAKSKLALRLSPRTPKAVRAPRCQVCSGCRRDDCKKCENCLDMVKYGGKNTKKQACKYRECQKIKEMKSTPKTPGLSGIKRMRDEGIDESNPGVKKSRQMSLLETFKKRPSSGNESDEY